MAKYRVPVLEKYEFQAAVLDKSLATPPVSPVKGDRYIVAASGTGDWSGKDKNIAWYDGVAWQFDVPLEGTLVWVKDEDKFYFYNGSSVWEDLTSAMGLGDMSKSTYDTDNDGIVDKAETVDDGEGNSSSAADIKDAVTKKHEHSNKATLDAIEEAFTTALKTAYDGAVTDSHTHSNKAVLDAIEESLTTALKLQYDEAYSKRASYDADLGVINFEL
jgi:hypothetical protein